MADDEAFEIEEASVEALQASMASGSLTSRALTEAYLGRIETIDPTLRSVLETNPDALEIADTLDAERRSGRVRGALHGIPTLVKDNIDTADGMRTTAGSFALGEVTPARDAFVVERLREAGAVMPAPVSGGRHRPVMDEHGLDALVAPSNSPAWRIDHANGDHDAGGNSTPAAVAGYPNLTVPMGFAFDLPIGISFMGRAWS